MVEYSESVAETFILIIKMSNLTNETIYHFTKSTISCTTLWVLSQMVNTNCWLMITYFSTFANELPYHGESFISDCVSTGAPVLIDMNQISVY